MKIAMLVRGAALIASRVVEAAVWPLLDHDFRLPCWARKFSCREMSIIRRAMRSKEHTAMLCSVADHECASRLEAKGLGLYLPMFGKFRLSHDEITLLAERGDI